MRRPGPKSHVDVGSVPSKSGGYLGRGGTASTRVRDKAIESWGNLESLKMEGNLRTVSLITSDEEFEIFYEGHKKGTLSSSSDSC